MDEEQQGGNGERNRESFEQQGSRLQHHRGLCIGNRLIIIKSSSKCKRIGDPVVFLVPTLRVGTHTAALRAATCPSFSRSHALRGNAYRGAPRRNLPASRPHAPRPSLLLLVPTL